MFEVVDTHEDGRGEEEEDDDEDDEEEDGQGTFPRA